MEDLVEESNKRGFFHRYCLYVKYIIHIINLSFIENFDAIGQLLFRNLNQRASTFTAAGCRVRFNTRFQRQNIQQLAYSAKLIQIPF